MCEKEQDQTNDENDENRLVLGSMEDKLDEDFLYFMTFTKTCFGELGNPKDRELADAWMRKLVAESYTRVTEKRNRNIYLSNLILAMQQGGMTGPFRKMPPHGLLLPTSRVFNLTPKGIDDEEPKFEETELDLRELNHLSGDGRTYLATKSVRNGLMGYLAVSVGGGDTKWVDREGNSVCPQECSFFTVQSPESVMQENVCIDDKSKKSPMQEVLEHRPTVEKRKELEAFYKDLQSRVDNELDSFTSTGKEPDDPHVKRMLDKLNRTIEQKEDGDTSDISAHDKMTSLLQCLKKKIACSVLKEKERAEFLEDIQKQCSPNFSTLNFGEATFGRTEDMDPSDSMWKEAVDHPVQAENLRALKAIYPNLLVEELVSLLKQERLRIVDLERREHGRYVDGMRRDLLQEITDGMEKYKAARQEWMKVVNVLKEIEALKKEDPEFKAGSKTSDIQELEKQLSCAMERNKMAHELLAQIEQEIEFEHARIHKFQLQGFPQFDAVKENHDAIVEISELKQEFKHQCDELRGLECRVSRLCGHSPV